MQIHLSFQSLIIFLIKVMKRQLQIFSSLCTKIYLKYSSEYDQEIPQSQTADNPVASRGRAAQPSRNTRKTN